MASFKQHYPLYLAGEPATTSAQITVVDKYNGQVLTTVSQAGPSEVEKATAAAVAAAPQFAALAAADRKEILAQCLRGIEARREELTTVLALEGGKALQHARLEVARFIQTFTLAMEESTRLYGQYLPLDIAASSKGVEAITKRVPIGPCSFIVPFNFPLNLAAHKIAPALAVGCPFVVKPASYTPVSLLIFGEILAGTAIPKGAFSILPADRKAADLLVTDERFKLLSFTGSPEVGWDMKKRAGKKKVVLELGGNAACIVDRDADLQRAAKRMMTGAFYQSGQSCISVQRILIHRAIYEPFKKRLIEETGKLISGPPLQEDTFIGPLISEQDARRIEDWVNDALTGGARCLVGGRRQASVYEPTLLENVSHTAKLSCLEAFGPVAVLEPFESFKDAVALVNDSAFGLQAGVFTSDIDHAFYAFNHLEVGSVVVNDVPSLRIDSMPYGGVKDSGLGREGVRFAMEDMTEIRQMVLVQIGQSGGS